ncbi:MAG: SulP family inorganic anion transporter [Gemmataceae bacterium]
MAESKTPAAPPPIAPSLFGNFRFDALAGFLVFLIAMPLCLAIARASGFPPIAGIWTAVIGGLICSIISNSELTIKGPAAGLIVIVFGCVNEFSDAFGSGLSDGDKAMMGYRLALGVGVASGILQVLFGLLRAGKLADFFPLTPVHGMLASIGIIIIAKQAYEVVGVAPEKGAGPLKLLYQFPSTFSSINPEIALIGVVSLVILFGLPMLPFKFVKRVPGQLVVLIVAIVMERYFDLSHEHTYLFPASFFGGGDLEYQVGPRFLVQMPEVLKDPMSAFAFPDFRGLMTGIGMKYLLLFSLIGTLESLLSAKAIELLDPWRRKTNFDRDVIGAGVANTISALVGGLPMISEIVRSSANINNGARTRLANFYHGMFLLSFVLLAPGLIKEIPLAALGAMLVYTGFRLASPKEFVRTYKIGSEQFVTFMTTILVTLAEDLLIGILAGVAMKIGFHLWNGAPISAMLKTDVDIVPEGDRMTILVVKKAAVFSNWLGLRTIILKEAEGRDEIVIDLSRTRLVDHSVMEKLHEMERLFEEMNKHLKVIGLEDHIPQSSHPLAARRRPATSEPVATA